MRPQGEVRREVMRCLAQRPCTLREVVQLANVGYQKARQTLSAALRAGQIEKFCTRRVPHSLRPVVVYRITQPNPDSASDWAIDEVIHRVIRLKLTMGSDGQD